MSTEDLENFHGNVTYNQGDDEWEPEPVYWPYTWYPTYEVIAAICGNWWQESTLNPGLYESRKVVPLTDNNVYGGYGLGQWTNSPKHQVYRRTALANWLSQNGWSYDSPVGQILYFLHENTWYKTGEAAAYDSLQEFLQSQSQDVTTLTYAFMRGWEGIWDGTQTIRVQAANQCLDYWSNWKEPTGWEISNNYLSNSKRLNNATMILKFMAGEDVQGNIPGKPFPRPPQSPREPGLKVWQMVRYL